ncbi:MAG: lipid-A-disaccharide synthase N-terminal domain-containing protein [Phycisphaeraceae bacterium]
MGGSRHGRRWWLMVWAAVVLGGLVLLVASKQGMRLGGTGFELSDRLASVVIEATEDGPMVRLGEEKLLSPQEFVAEVKRAQAKNADRGLVYALLDITSWTGMLWVGFGFLAQAVFMGRMLIQWILSERAGRSVVPEAFWWLSLIGSSMLLIYFTWRIEPVGFVGQLFGWVVYVRNLWMIRKEDRVAGAGAVKSEAGGG